ncbi:MAG: HAD-IA family hydrolase [Luteolibacter sp.]
MKRSIELSGADFDAEDFLEAWRNVFTRNLPMLERVRALKKAGGHRLILFSNTNSLHDPWIFEEFPELDQFDGKVLSYEVGAMKPAPAIYEYAIREFSLDPASTLYIDDLAENIAAGERYGFRCHLYRLDDHAAFETWLARELEKA